MFEVSAHPLDANHEGWGRVLLLPWDTDIFGFPVGAYEPGEAKDIQGGLEAFGERFRA